MSAEDTVPTLAEVADDTPEELEEWLVETFEDIAERNWDRQGGGHDTDGYFAYVAGSEQCAKLGHASHVDYEHAAYEEWDELHPYGWDDDRICIETRHGIACSQCEGDCMATAVPRLWEQPGVIGAQR